MKHILPTPEQKLRLYTKVRELVIANEYGTRCICQAIYHAQADLGFVNADGNNLWSKRKPEHFSFNHMGDNFPELVKIKPANKQYYQAWWNVNDKKVNPARLRAINKMIVSVLSQIEVVNF